MPMCVLLHLVAAAAVLGAALPAATAAPSKAASFATVVGDFAKASRFRGVVLVADHGKPVYRQAFGLANEEWRQPNTVRTRFRIASVTKTFTAVLVMQAVEAGRLHLDAPISTWLPAYADQPFAAVTVDELLTYASGLSDRDQTEGMTPYQQPLDAAAFVARFGSGPLQSPPGSRFAYKNIDYRLLEQLLEAVEGKPFATLVAERIAAPLGLRDTAVLRSGDLVQRLASAYVVDEADATATLRADPPYFPESFGAAGGMRSTVDDLLRFDTALREQRLLNAQSTATMLRPHEALGYVAYGFWTYPCSVAGRDTRCAERQGAIQGSNALWLRDLDHGRSFIVLSNSSEADLQKLKGLLTDVP